MKKDIRKKCISVLLVLFIVIFPVGVSFAETSNDPPYETDAAETEAVPRLPESDKEPESNEESVAAAEQNDEGPVLVEPADTELEPVPEPAEPSEAQNDPLQYRELSETSVIVMSFAELKEALAGSNAVSTIYLGNDIQVEESGIRISSDKENITIVGHLPDDVSGTRYTIYDFPAAGGVRNNAITFHNANTVFTLRDAKIVGNNVYGTFSSPDNLNYRVTTEYINVDYTGPKMSYNRHGLVRYIDCNITIKAGVSGSPSRSRLAEAAKVELGGRTTVNKPEGDGVLFWFYGNTTEKYLKVLDGAKITANTVRDFMYVEGYGDAVYEHVDVVIGKSAALDVTAKLGFLRNGEHRINTLLIDEGGTLRIYHTTGESANPALQINSMLKMEKDSTLLIQREGSGVIYRLIRFYFRDARMVLNNPRRFCMYNASGTGAMRFLNGGTFSGTVNAINVWDETGDGFTDSIDNTPTNMWNKDDSGTFSFNVIFSNNAVTAVSADLGSDDPQTDEFNASTMNMLNTNMVVMGSHYMDVDNIYPDSADIAGITQPGACVRAVYGSGTTNAAAETNGRYAMPVNHAFIPGGMVNVLSHNDFLKIRKNVIVREHPGTIAFSADDVLAFESVTLTGGNQLIGRADADWAIVVSDKRENPAPWKLEAVLAEPFTALDGEGEHVLGDALVFVDEKGQTNVLDSSQTLIHLEESSQPQTTTRIEWTPDKGILVNLNGQNVRSGIPYKATIRWLLSDTI